MARIFEGDLVARGGQFGIVVARFNGTVTSALLDGARSGLIRHGVADDSIDVIWVPGALEIPLAASRLAQTGHYAAVICLGAIIRGETAHFDYVAAGAAQGINRVGLDTGVPVIFGVLTTDTVDQAMARAGGKQGNKGYDAAETALEMVNLLSALRPAPL
ncbi:MAG: 6,7-dimethyl-8-ribityllumazine synthase [Chloroflexota bacterium]